jgi:hypothetical protein
MAMFFDKSEGRETAFYAVLSVQFIVAFAWFIVTFGLFSA